MTFILAFCLLGFLTAVNTASLDLLDTFEDLDTNNDELETRRGYCVDKSYCSSLAHLCNKNAHVTSNCQRTCNKYLCNTRKRLDLLDLLKKTIEGLLVDDFEE